MTDSVTNKIILSADSTCDLDQELKERYHVHYFPLHIILDGKDYKDGIDITPEEIYQKYYDEKILPKTAAVNVAEYIEHFKPLVAVWCCLAVRSPVEIYDDQVCTLFFYCIDIICQLCPALTYLFVNGRYTDKSDLDAFDLKNRGIVVAKSRDPCVFQSGLCFGQTGGSVIFGVIVGKVDSLDRTVRECGNIGRIAFINIALAG